MSRVAVVLTAGTQNTGAIDPIREAMKSLRNIGLSKPGGTSTHRGLVRLRCHHAIGDSSKVLTARIQ